MAEERFRGPWQRIRKQIIRRDGGRCQICGAPGNVVDHRIPYVLGGGETWSNLQTLCGCGDFTPAVDECSANDHDEPFLDYEQDPFVPPGDDWAGYWFLVRATWGPAPLTYDDVEHCCDAGPASGMQHHPRDAEIDGSTSACP